MASNCPSFCLAAPVSTRGCLSNRASHLSAQQCRYSAFTTVRQHDSRKRRQRSRVQYHETAPAPRRETPVAKAKGAPPKDLNTLRVALVDACLDSSLNRGLSLDPDADSETAAEELVEDLAEQLEDRNPCAVPTASPDMDGKWELIYTSSSLTRFHGGLSGIQKYVDGTVGRITQDIDTESGVCTFYEQIAYQMPVVRKPAEVTVTVTGKIRAVNETRQMWTPETINAAWFKLWAESWKSVRAFTIAETTYLDKELRITRGQTGSLTIYGRTQKTD